MKNKIISVLMTVFMLLYFVPPLSNEYSTLKAEVIKQEVSAEYNKQITCMAKAIYYESGSEPYEGKLSVAQVTMNRVNNPNYPKDVCGVVYQKTNGSCQYSWTCSEPSIEKNRYIWEESLMIAKRALTEPYVHDIMYKSQALFFHGDYVNPEWKLKRVGQVGKHIFYSNNKI